jgi:hypothetical protein
MKRYGKCSAMALAVCLAGCSSTHRTQEQPSVLFGTSRISLGMTRGDVEQHLSESSRHMIFQDPLHAADKDAAIVLRNGESDGPEGSIRFRGDRVVAAGLSMPDAKSVGELAEQIANAVDRMEVKACTAENSRNVSMSGASQSDFVQTHFTCGARTFDITTFRFSGPSIQHTTTSVFTGIREPGAK